MSERKIKDLCRVGGDRGGHPNYMLPHVTGAVYWEDGRETKATNCVFCGKEIEQ